MPAENPTNNIEAEFGALLPHDFVSGNVKLEYLRLRGHAAFASDRIPDDVIEILQEFLEILEYREELDGAGRSSGDA